MDRLLSRLEDILMVALIFIAFIVGLSAVTLRYVFGTGVAWSEGVFVQFTVWSILVAGSRAVRENLHVTVEYFLSMYGPKLRWISELSASVVSLCFCAFIGYCGYLYSKFVWDMNAVSMVSYIPEWIIYGSIPLSMSLFCIRYAQYIFKLIKYGKVPEVDLDTRISQGL